MMSLPHPVRVVLALGFMMAGVCHSPLPADAAALLDSGAARVAAVKILKGDPYGKTDKAVMLNIKISRLISKGPTNCSGAVAERPVWQFRIVVPASRNPNGGQGIDGILLIDARTGKLECATLPFLS